MGKVKLSTVLFMLLFVLSCGGGGGSSAIVPPPPVNPVPNIGGGEGSASNPVSLGVIGPPATHSGSIGAGGESYYKFTTDGNGGTYKISLTNTHSTLEWDLYSNSTFGFGTDLMYCSNWGSGDVTCLTNSAGNLQANTNYYLEVLEYGLSADTYTLTVSEVVSEGTPTTPVLLTVGTPYAGSVNGSGNSYYKFQTNSAGEYSIAISNATSFGGSSIGISISSTDFSSPSLLKTCTAGYNPTCTVNGLAANTYYYVQVVQTYSYDAVYNITVTMGSSEGSVASPVALTYGANHAGAVDGSGMSYYTFTPTNTGDSILTLTGTSTLYATVYSGSDFSSGQIRACAVSTGSPCTISGVNAGVPYYISISNSSTSKSTYTINVSSGNSEGSANSPVQLALGTPHSASVDGNGASYYYFNTGPNSATSGSGSYTFTFSTPVTWSVYSDTNFSTPAGNNLDANKNYYLLIQNPSSTGMTLTVTVSTGSGNSEGSVNTPIPLTEGTAYSGRIGTNGYSYYTFTPSKNTPYLIRLTNIQQTGMGLSWDLYATSNFSGISTAYNSLLTYSGDIMGSTPSALTAGTPYYLEIQTWGASGNAYTITITPFDVSTGCNSGGTATCFNFDSGTIPTTNSFTNNSSPGTAPWAFVASTIGGGTYSFKSTVPSGPKVTSYLSCFQFTATDVKWVGISREMVTTGGNDYINYYIDGALLYGGVSNTNAVWGRDIITSSSSGTHTYEWCYSKNSTATGDYAEVDDIELNY